MEIRGMVTHSEDAVSELYLIPTLPQEKRTVTDQIRDTASSATLHPGPIHSFQSTALKLQHVNYLRNLFIRG